MPDARRPVEKFKAAIATPEVPWLGPQRRPGTLGEAELNRRLTDHFAAEKVAAAVQPLLRSAALLWHDHLDASHTISQGIETRDGSWLHGIMHRREPDYGNAKYWFHRVGRHEAFSELAPRVAALLPDGGGMLTSALLANGEWMPLDFIDECERAEPGNDPVLRRIQAVEFDVLVEHILSR